MIKLDDDLLQQLGLAGLPPEEKKKLLAHIYETLEMRVGMKLAEQMSDAQLTEFERFIETNDEAGALHWLETNFPNYKDVVSAEFEALKKEVEQLAPQIMAASMQQPQPMPVDPMAGQGQMPGQMPPMSGMPPEPQQYPGPQPPQPAPMPPSPQGQPQPQQWAQPPQAPPAQAQQPWGPPPPPQAPQPPQYPGQPGQPGAY